MKILFINKNIQLIKKYPTVEVIIPNAFHDFNIG